MSNHSSSPMIARVKLFKQLTLMIGLVALALFFFPWISLNVDSGEESHKGFSQTGFQAATGSPPLTQTDETGTAAENKQASKPGKAIPVLISLIFVGVGLLCSIRGTYDRLRPLQIAQLFYIAAALMITLQMAHSFPAADQWIKEEKGRLEMSMEHTWATNPALEFDLRKQHEETFRSESEMASFACVTLLALSLILLISNLVWERKLPARS